MSDRSPSRAAWKQFRAPLVIAGLQVVGGLLLALAAKRGLIGVETMIRGVLVLIGLSLAAIGNTIPKTLDRQAPQTRQLAALRQSVMRIAGWAMMLGGLAFAGLSAFAPLELTQIAAPAVLGAAIAVMCGFVAWWIITYHRSARL